MQNKTRLVTKLLTVTAITFLTRKKKILKEEDSCEFFSIF